jgi:hypothetical protein
MTWLTVTEMCVPESNKYVRERHVFLNVGTYEWEIQNEKIEIISLS